VGVRNEWTDWPLRAPVLEDSTEAVREWRWRCYIDRLRDLGYDLDGGQPREGESPSWAPAGGEVATGSSADAG
jgi:hypothetical protein